MSETRYTPPFSLSPNVLALIADILELLARMGDFGTARKLLQLRRANRIRTIQASLAIEQNTLSVEQVSAIVEGRRVVGPIREIHEVENAVRLYDHFDEFNPVNLKDLLRAQGMLMEGLVENPGHFRSGGVGVIKGREIVHLAPPADMVPGLVKDLLAWLKRTDVSPLVSAAVFHYEFEFIHPFSDGNGRMGRMWQSLILAKWNPLFESLPVETVVRDRQNEYYEVLAVCDRCGDATVFVEFILDTIIQSLQNVMMSDQVSD